MVDIVGGFGPFLLENKTWIALGFFIFITVSGVVWWKRRGKDYSPTTVLMEFDANGISTPHYVHPADEGNSFVAYQQSDSSFRFRKKSRIPISIPDAKGMSYDRIYWNPKGSDTCVEPESEFPDYKPPPKESWVDEVISENADEFEQIRVGSHPAGIGTKGKLIFLAIVILGVVGGIILDASVLHAGAH